MNKKIAVFFVVAVFWISGCGKELPPAVLSEELPVFRNVTYQLETDDPFFAQRDVIAFAPTGYYFAGAWDYLYFWDKATGQIVPLCTKVNCLHNEDGYNTDCDALFDLYEYRHDLGIWYREGYLYMLNSGGAEQEYSLVRVRADGTGREKVADLFEIAMDAEGNQEDALSDVFCHRGYLYYAMDGGSRNAGEIYRCALEPGAKPELFFVYPGDVSSVGAFKGYGDGFFFHATTYFEEEKAAVRLCYVDTDGNASQLLEHAPHFYTVAEERLFYNHDNAIWVLDLNTGEREAFFESGGVSDLSYDGTHLWIDDCWSSVFGEGKKWKDRMIYCLTLDGTVVDEWNVDGRRTVINGTYFGDEDYLFMDWIEGDGKSLKVLDKETGEWVKLN